jgi:hypothetical protein
MGLSDILWTCVDCGWSVPVTAGPLTATVQGHECFGTNCKCNNRGTGHYAAGHDWDCDSTLGEVRGT